MQHESLCSAHKVNLLLLLCRIQEQSWFSKSLPFGIIPILQLCDGCSRVRAQRVADNSKAQHTHAICVLPDVLQGKLAKVLFRFSQDLARYYPQHSVAESGPVAYCLQATVTLCLSHLARSRWCRSATFNFHSVSQKAQSEFQVDIMYVGYVQSKR